MKFLTKLLRLDFDPDRDGLPGVRVKEPDKGTGQVQTEKKDNLHHLDSGKATYEKNDDGSWDLYSASTRSAELTDQDKDHIDTNGWVKEDKYRRIKAKWAIGLSIKDASDALTREYGRGHKTKTVEKYFKLINQAAGTGRPSPVSARGEDHRTTPQKAAALLLNIQY